MRMFIRSNMRKRTNTRKEELKIIEEEKSSKTLESDLKEKEALPASGQKFGKMRSDDSKAVVIAREDLEVREFEDTWEGGEQEKESSRGLLVGLLLAVTVLVGGLVAWTVFFFPDGQGEAEQEKMKLVQAKREQGELVDYSAQAVIQIKDQVKLFFSAESVQDLKQFVDMPERVSPLIDQYYKEFPWESQSVEVVSLQPITLSLTPYWMVQYKGMSDGLVIVTEGKDGYKVDWESYACYNPVTLEELIETGVSVNTPLRVYAKADDYYSYQFDERTYQCLRLTTRDEETHLWAYIERTSREYIEFYRAVADDPALFSERGRPVMLKISRPEEDTRANCFIIDDFVSSDWLHSERKLVGY